MENDSEKFISVFTHEGKLLKGSRSTLKNIEKVILLSSFYEFSRINWLNVELYSIDFFRRSKFDFLNQFDNFTALHFA